MASFPPIPQPPEGRNANGSDTALEAVGVETAESLVQGTASSHIEFWRSAWKEFQCSRWYRPMKIISGLALFIAFAVFGLTYLVIGKWLFPFLPKLGWVAVGLGMLALTELCAIQFLGRFHNRTIASRDTGLHKQLDAANSTIRELTANWPIVHFSYELHDLFTQHDHALLEGYQAIALINEGPATVFEVLIEGIDLGSGRIATFEPVPNLGTEPQLIYANVEYNGVPVFAQHDLAHALYRAVNASAISAIQEERDTIVFPTRLTYRDRNGRRFESTCEIRAYGLPLHQTVKTHWTGVREIGN